MLISWRRSIKVAVCVSLLSAGFGLSTAGHWIERTLVLETAFQLRGSRTPPVGVVIVNLDKRGADLPSSSRSGRFWSRNIYASIIDELRAADASVIVLDVAFEGATEELADKALEESLARNDKVILFNRLKRTEEGDVAVDILSRFSSLVPVQAVFPLPKLSRVDSYWPFFPVLASDRGSDEFSEQSSLPVAALQVQLIHLIGIEPFARLLTVDDGGASGGSDSDSAQAVDAATLLVDLRKKYSGNRISDSAIDKLFMDQQTSFPTVVPMLRSLFDIYAGRGLLSLNFYGTPRTIQTIDHMSVIPSKGEDSTTLREIVSGKVVFIGYSSSSAVDQKDGFRTVYTRDGLDLSGVEIAATAYANLLDRSALRPTSIFFNVLTHVLLGIALALIFIQRSILQTAILTMAFVFAYCAFAMSIFTYTYRILPIGVPLLIMLPCLLFSMLFLRNFGFERLFAIYRERFKKMNPAIVWDDMESADPENVLPKHMHGTCMITDIENFTYFAELLEHERVGKLSQEYFALVTEHVTKTGGELFDVDGDSITVFWESSEVSADSGLVAANAAIAAIGIKHEVALFNKRYPDTPFKTRIGLNCGWVEASYIGGGGKFRYCLVGDVANTSSRLESLNKRLGTTLLASKALFSDSEMFLLRPVGIFQLKGKIHPLEVVEIIDHQTSVTANERFFCKHFEYALDQISKHQYVQAEKNLVDILLTYGTDGPARFYLELITGHGSTDVHLGERGLVLLEGK